MLELGRPRRLQGYATDLVTDLAIGWIEARDPSRPFCVLVHHKAPHRPWLPDDEHAGLYQADQIPEPPTFGDDYRHRSAAAAQARMRVADDLGVEDLKAVVPPGLAGDQRASWAYQRYIRDYLRCVASLDDNLGRLLGYLDDAGLAGETVVVYTSDQGFFLGDHGWYDKRFMYEESLRMPLLVRYPSEVPKGSLCQAMVLNVDFAQTLLDLAGVPAHPRMQGRSLRPLLAGRTPPDWRRSIYYRYWEHDDGIHHVWAHYGVRTLMHKLVYYYADGLGVPGASAVAHPPQWELFDLERDPFELQSVHDDPGHAAVRRQLTLELGRVQAEVGDRPWRADFSIAL
jgi:arylsulfatase A-like enzyme